VGRKVGDVVKFSSVWGGYKVVLPTATILNTGVTVEDVALLLRGNAGSLTARKNNLLEGSPAASSGGTSLLGIFGKGESVRRSVYRGRWRGELAYL